LAKLGMMQNNCKIAVTGGIGSGKSVAVSIIKELGYPVFSCDQITAVLYENKTVLKGLKKIFPTAIKGIFNLKADKKEIARIIFSDKSKYEQLNDFLMPLILSELFDKLKGEKGLVFAEVPLLFEFNATNYFDKIIVVTRELNARIESVKTRSKLSTEQIKERIASQFDYDNNDLSSYEIITNNGTIADLEQQVKDLIEQSKTDLN
jgi:dephospho-CoA kinase